MARRSLLWPDPRVKPPFGSVEVDRGHPLAPDMSWLYNEGAGLTLFDLAGPARATITEPTNVRWTPTRGGIGLSAVAGTDAAGITIANGLTLTGAAGWSWTTHCSPTSASENYGLLCTNAISNMGMFFRGSVLKLVVYIAGDNVATTAITSATRHHFAVSMVSASAGTQYLDGIANGNISGVGTDWIPFYQLNFPGATVSFDGTVEYQSFWRRPLTSSEIAWLAAEPYAMFRPIIRRRYFVPAAGGPTIIEAEFTASGAATVTGVSGAVAGSVLTAAGIGAMTGAGAAVWLGTLVSAGAATVIADAQTVTIVGGDLTAQGVATVAGVSGATAGSVFTSAGVAVLTGQGEDAAAPGGGGAMMTRHHHHGV